MDEEAFPRKESPTSLDLLKEEKIYIPRSGDVDRYLMLQALFAAEEFLYFSYGHLSSEEGKPIAPSLALQELLTDIDAHFEGGKWLHTAPYLKTYPEQKGLGDFFGIHETFPELPQGEVTLYLSDLVKLARHPCDFYLQKKLGIYVEKSPFDSFPAQKSYLARESLQEPFEAVAQTHREKFAPGLVGTAQKLEIEELIHNWEEQLSDWNLKLSVWSMLATCKEKSEVSSQLVEIPPITLQINDHLLVKIVGDLKTMSERGFVSTSDELLKIWPEALVSAIVSKSPEIFLLKKGKIIEMHEPEEKLRLFVIYYFRALAQASPLITNWADFILNGGKMEKSRFEDSVADWVLSRITLPKEEELLAKWGWLKEVFQHAAL